MTEEQFTLTYRLDGEVFAVDLGDLTGLDWRDIRIETGLRMGEVVSLAIAADFEAIAALVWVVRRRDDPKLTYTDVLGSLTLSHFEVVTPAEVPADPPGSGGPS